jgi:hypothetical protein
MAKSRGEGAAWMAGRRGQMLNIANFINKTMWLWFENEKKAIPLEVIWP